MAILITKLMSRSLLAVGLILATISTGSAQNCLAGPSVFYNQTCHRPYGTHYNGQSTFMAQCGAGCPACTPDPPTQSSVPRDPAPAQQRPKLGVQIVTGGTDGALVKSVRPGSPAEDADIRPGDKIVSLDGQAITSGRELVEAIGQMSSGQQVTVSIERPGTSEELGIPVTLR